MKQFITLFWRTLTWITVGILLLLLLIITVVQVPYVQNKIVNKATSFLTEKIKTPVHIGKVLVSFPKKIVIEDIFLEDQKRDTLLKADKISVDMSMLGLLSNQLNINKIYTKGLTASIDRNSDGVFNFDYIVNAFASADTVAKKDSKPMEIMIHSVQLEDFKANYQDDYGKTYANAHWENFFLNFDIFNLDSKHFEIDDFRTKNLTASIKILKSDNTETDNQKAPETQNKNPLQLALGGIDFRNSDIYFLDENSDIETSITWNKLKLDANKIQLDNTEVSIQDFQIHNLKGFLNMSLAKETKQTETNVMASATDEESSLKVNLEHFLLKDSDFEFNAINHPKTKQGVDFKHLKINNLTIAINDFKMDEDGTSGTIAKLKLTEQSGLKINDTYADFLYGAENSYLRNFRLTTPHSNIEANGEISYSSQKMLSENPERSEIQLDLGKTHIASDDILLLAPQLKNTPPFDKNPKAVYYTSGKAKGLLGNFRLHDFKLSTLKNTSVALSGRIKGLPNTENLYVDIPNIKMQTIKNEIVSLLPKNTMPANLQLPDDIKLDGSVKGSLKDLGGDFSLNTNLGTAKLKGSFNQLVKDNELFSLEGNVQDFQLGKLLNNSNIGNLSADINIKGKGLNPKTMIADGDILVKQFAYNGYAYNDLNLKGNIQNAKYELHSRFDDKNAKWNLEISGNMQGEYPSLHVDSMIDKLDLYQMKLTSSPQAVRLKIDADFKNLDPDHPIGNLTLSDFSYSNGEKVFPFKDMIFKSYKKDNVNYMEFDSQFIQFLAEGKYQLTKLPNSLQNTVAHYYNDIKPVIDTIPTKPQKLNFRLHVSNNHMLPEIIPALEYIDPINLTFEYDSEKKFFDVNGTLPTVKYAGMNIEGVHLYLQSADDLIWYQVGLDKLQNDMFRLTPTSFSGTIKEDFITYDFSIKDFKEQNKYKIQGEVKTVNNERVFDINPLKIILNYDQWDVNEKNSLLYSDGNFEINEFTVSNGKEKISINSLRDNNDIPLEVVFQNFDLKNLSNVVESEKLNISGVVNGKTELNLKKSSVLADIHLKNLKLINSSVGDLHLTAQNKSPEIIEFGLELSGNGNSLTAEGNINTKLGKLNLDTDIQKLQMESLQAFTLGNLKESKGHLSGKINVQKSKEDIDLQGNIDFNEVEMIVTKLNSKFQNINDKIIFKNDKVQFDNFSIYDEKNNELNVNGFVQLQDAITFNLEVSADNFTAVNSTITDNDMFYGQLSLNTDLKIKGNTDLPVVSGSIDINKNTDFTFVLPQSDPGIANREGVIRFESEKDSVLEQTLVMKQKINRSKLKGMDVSVNISIDKEASTTLVIDKGNGDYLKVKGEGELTGGIDPSGNTTLTGKYTITEGAYELTLDFIKRSFNIEEGSYLQWNGTPTDAKVNITAAYQANTPPIDLLGQQLSGLSANMKNQYKQNLPFQAILMMKGELLSPEISFDLKLGKDGLNSVSSNVVNSVKRKLEQLNQNQSELYKQVFALLLLNRFVGENPFASEVETSAATMAQQSVSKIISQQLNTWAADLVKGVNLNFDLQSKEDYSSGEAKNRTDLNVDISKSLFDDRLKISVGSSFGVQGENRQNERANNIAGNILIEYALSKDGRYMLKAYRKNEYQVALQGEIVETGVAFVITMSYNKFRELFSKSENKKKKTPKNK